MGVDPDTCLLFFFKIHFCQRALGRRPLEYFHAYREHMSIVLQEHSSIDPEIMTEIII